MEGLVEVELGELVEVGFEELDKLEFKGGFEEFEEVEEKEEEKEEEEDEEDEDEEKEERVLEWRRRKEVLL